MKKQFAVILVALMSSVWCSAQECSAQFFESLIDSVSTNPEYVTRWANETLERNRKCSDAYVAKALVALSQENYKQGLSFLNDALLYVGKRSVYSYSKILCARGLVYEVVEESDFAMADYSQAIQADPKAPEGYELRAALYESLEQYSLAEEDYYKLVHLTDSLSHKLSLVKCLMAQKKTDESLAILDKMIRYQPRQADPYAFRSWVHSVRQEIKPAIDDYVAFMSLGGDFSYASFASVASLSYGYSMNILANKLSSSEDNVNWIMARIQLNIVCNHYDLALTDLDMVESSYGESIYSVYMRSLCYAGLYEYTKQVSLLTKLIGMLETPDADIYSARGTAYRNTGRFQEAYADYDMAIQLEPTQSNHFTERAWTKEMQHKDREAMVDYNTALSFNPDNEFALLQRGKLYLNNQDTVNAYIDFTHVLELDSMYTPRAYALVLLGKTEEGYELMNQIVANSTDKTGDYYDQACLYALGKRSKDAIEALRLALDNGYKNYNHMMNDRDLDIIKQEPEFIALTEGINKNRVTSLFQSLGQ